MDLLTAEARRRRVSEPPPSPSPSLTSLIEKLLARPSTLQIDFLPPDFESSFLNAIHQDIDAALDDLSLRAFDLLVDHLSVIQAEEADVGVKRFAGTVSAFDDRYSVQMDAPKTMALISEVLQPRDDPATIGRPIRALLLDVFSAWNQRLPLNLAPEIMAQLLHLDVTGLPDEVVWLVGIFQFAVGHLHGGAKLCLLGLSKVAVCDHHTMESNPEMLFEPLFANLRKSPIPSGPFEFLPIWPGPNPPVLVVMCQLLDAFIDPYVKNFFLTAPRRRFYGQLAPADGHVMESALDLLRLGLSRPELGFALQIVGLKLLTVNLCVLTSNCSVLISDPTIKRLPAEIARVLLRIVENEAPNARALMQAILVLQSVAFVAIYSENIKLFEDFLAVVNSKA
jgi:hypothetical protein